MTDAAEATCALQHEAWLARTLPDMDEVQPGIWSIPLPLVNGTMRYVIVYALVSVDGLTLIDAGWDDDVSWSRLASRLNSIGHSTEDVRRILVTHVHRDHYGNAGRLRRGSGATIYMHARERATLPDRLSIDELAPRIIDWLRRCGVKEADAVQMLPRSARQPMDMPAPDQLVDDGDRLAVPGFELEVIWTPGHSPGHLCFLERSRGLLFSGDHVLPRITSNVGVGPRQSVDPLGEYLTSLASIRGLSVDDVLPGHEYRFAGLRERADRIIEHHRDRLEHVRRKLRDEHAATAYEVAAACSWSRPWADMPLQLRRLAVGETASHLVFLEACGDVSSDMVGNIEWWRHGN